MNTFARGVRRIGRKVYAVLDFAFGARRPRVTSEFDDDPMAERIRIRPMAGQPRALFPSSTGDWADAGNRDLIDDAEDRAESGTRRRGD